MSTAIAAQPEPSPTVSSFLKRPHGLLIGGEWVGSRAGEHLPVIDPALGRNVSTVASAGSEDVERAVAAARTAFERGPWRDMSPARRELLLWNLATLIEMHADELAELESIDNGKTKRVADTIDVPATRNYFRYMAGWATKIEGSTLDISSSAVPGAKFHTYTKREPVGVVAQIVPWNFPLLMAAWKLAPALATGCTCVLKPAEHTSMTALRLGELIIEAGFPPGVVNILTGRGDTAGAALVAHSGIDKIAFTGSTAVGKLVNKSATDSVKRVSLELGGKSPVIVFPDADLDAATAGATKAIFFNHGQVCFAGSRLYAHREVFDRVVEGISRSALSLKLGPGLDPQTQIGPLISKEQQERVMRYIESGKRQGASITAGGNTPSCSGYYVEPTVLVNVKPEMCVVREEIFGPVLVAQRFEEADDIAMLANDSAYGLAASVWSRDLKTVHRIVPKLRAGTVWVNCHGVVDPNMPFGGYKQSGFGREHGRTALDLYTELKSVWMAA